MLMSFTDIFNLVISHLVVAQLNCCLVSSSALHWTWTKAKDQRLKKRKITGEGCKNLSKQGNVPVNTVAIVIKKCKIHGTLWTWTRGKSTLAVQTMWMLDQKPKKTSIEIQARTPRSRHSSVRSHHLSPFEWQWTKWMKTQE